MTLSAGGVVPDELAARRVRRRQRGEIEALASQFVGAPAPGAAPPRRPPILAAALASAITFVVLFILLWPGREEPVARPGTPGAASEVSAWQQRFEAERERRRKEMESGADYLNRAAAADAELLQDMTARAQSLARREAAPRAALPVARDEPTPKSSTSRSATSLPQPAVAPAPLPAQAMNAPAAAPQPAAPVAKAAPPAGAAAPVSTASASCTLHVADLSSSGKLTYDAVAHMKGARVDPATGHVFTPPVQANGRTLVFEVTPDSCVRIVHRPGE